MTGPGSTYPPYRPGAASLPPLGERARRRAQPRLGVSLAGAGLGLIVLGVLVWSTSYLVEGMAGSIANGGSPDDTRRVLGALLSFAVAAGGFVLATRWRHGPCSAAGVGASALGVPSLMLFATFSSGQISADAVFWVSLLVWLVSYLVVPGTRGHAFYLGLSASALVGYVVYKIEYDDVARLVLASINPSPLDLISQQPGRTPDLTSTAVALLLFGVAYYALAFALDRAGRRGVAVALLYAAFGSTATGIAAAAPDVEQIGTGLLLIVLGGAIAWCAARSRRRFTTWVSSGGVALGLALIAGKVAGADHVPLAGGLLVLVGVALVVIAVTVSSALGEVDEMVGDGDGDLTA